jgi:predicted DNA binding CopG/RHH family protein
VKDTVLSLRFTRQDVDRWKKAASVRGLSLTEFAEKAFNDACEKTR